MHCPQLIIRVHDGNQHGGWAQRAANIFGIHHAARAHAHVGHGDAFLLELCARIQYCRMLDRRRDHVLLRPVHVAHHAEQRQIVRLRAATHKNDFLRLAADERRRLTARHFQALLGHLAKMMDTGRVTVHFGETRHHGLDDLGGHRRRSVMVEVIAIHLLTV